MARKCRKMLVKVVSPRKRRTTESHPYPGVSPRKSRLLAVSPQIRKDRASSTPLMKLPPIFLIIFILFSPLLYKTHVLTTNMTTEMTIVTLALRKWRESMIGLTDWLVSRVR